jgi:hypothetical protein
MEHDEDENRTQEEVGEAPTIEEVEARVEAEMKRLEGHARERVAHGLQDESLEMEGRQLREESLDWEGRAYEGATNKYEITIYKMLAEMLQANEKIEREQEESGRLKAETREILSRLKAA